MTAGPRARLRLLCLALAATLVAPEVYGWGPQGHRLVALLAANYLTATATQNVTWLLGDQSLADVSIWADQYRDDNSQTGLWHFVNIPSDATRYDRDRDCPRQPGVQAGARGDRWRDCVVDRIAYHQERLADPALDRPDRAVALKFLVHLVGDLHQPFHAIGVERGGNGILVSAFGSSNCSNGGGAARPCNLHGVWDTSLIAHRRLNDRQYLARLEPLVADGRWRADALGTPAQWAMESQAIARRALLAPHADAGEVYYRAQIVVIDERLAIGGRRLAELVNRSLAIPPPLR